MTAGQATEMSSSLKVSGSSNATTAKTKKPRKQRKAKPVRDERKPVRPQTAFLFFLQESRKSILEELKHPETGKAPLAHEVSKHAGALWRQADEKMKSKYEKLAAEAKVTYDAALAEYKKLLEQEN